MPRVPDDILQGTFFLYDSAEDAHAGRDPQGTGFLIGKPLTTRYGMCAIYAVTNWHVACRGASVIRLNNRDGTVSIIDKGPEEWTFRADGHDLAITPIMGIDPTVHDARFYELSLFHKNTRNAIGKIGAGEDVFMCGLLVDAQGVERNQAAVRFGNISMMPRPIRNELGNEVPTYCISMPSRTGFSGSPVFAYRRIGQSFQGGPLDLKDQFLCLLGVHYGQFPERWNILKGAAKTKAEGVIIEQEDSADFIKGMSGMTLVVPAEEIERLLEEPPLKAWFEYVESQYPSPDFTIPVGEDQRDFRSKS